MIRKYLPKNVEELAGWYMRYISPLALVAALLLDYFVLLRRVDLWTSHALLFSYLAIAALCIVVLNLITSGRLQQAWLLKITPLIPVVAQFAFGGLFGGYLSLYSRSAAFAVSWIFVLIVAGLLLGNERFVRQYMKFSFQISIFFTVLFSFFIFFLPVIFHRIGPYMFFASGLTSLCTIALFLWLLHWLTPEIVLKERTRVARIIAVIFVVFNVLYFTNAIPPLPLALKDAGVYHGVTRTVDGDYTLLAEPVPWYEAYLRYNTLFHHTAGDSAYVFSAIFAPSGLSTLILHEWQRHDTQLGQWVTTNVEEFPIVGGRDGGYRGYSFKSNISPGKWRVNVITPYGQLIGRISFTVVEASSAVSLEDILK